MKLSEGFTKTLPSVLTFIFYIGTLIMLTFALKELNMSLVYAIWSGVGITLITLVGYFFFEESFSVAKLLFIALIIIGVVGLNLVGGEAHA